MMILTKKGFDLSKHEEVQLDDPLQSSCDVWEIIWRGSFS